MSEKEEEKEKKAVPPPTIKDTPPEKPPTTTADAGPPPEKKEEPKKDEPEGDESSDEIIAESENEQGAETDLGNRIVGGLIDGVVASGLSFVLAFLPIPFIGMLGNAVAIAYFLLRDSLPFLDGQSLGKKVVGSRAVKEDGSHLTNDHQTAALRNVWMLIPFLELIVLIVRKDKPEAGRRLGDDFAKTKVINVG